MPKRRRAAIAVAPPEAAMPDVSAFAPKPAPNRPDVERVARESGFTTTHGAPPRASVVAPPMEEVYDARRRRTPKEPTCGFNITVPVRLKNEFWALRDELDLSSGASVLEHLLRSHAAKANG